MHDAAENNADGMDINARIEAEVEQIRTKGLKELPKGRTPLVKQYISKIEGRYRVGRAKSDTDHAIDLLYIAYNTTPQTEGNIRGKISEIMDKLIKAQQASNRTMEGAMRAANNIVEFLDDALPDWLDVKESFRPDDPAGVAAIKEFVGKDLLELAGTIKRKALVVKDDLQSIADTYSIIIKDTAEVTSGSEKALSTSLHAKAAVEQEILEANAKRLQLESLVNDLQEEVKKFEKLARDYESRAKSSEDKAFVMSLVQTGAQLISGAIPAIAMASGGVGSLLAASTLSVARRGAETGAAGGDSEQAALQKKREISEKGLDAKTSEAKQAEIKANIRSLETERAQLADTIKAKEPSDSSQAKSDPEASLSLELAELDKRIEKAKADLKVEESKAKEIEASITSLQSSLDALESKLTKLTSQQQDLADNLRAMQMKMLEKVEAYEKEKRGQTAELVKINALLKGKRTQDETIQLAVRSLNMSLSALKRTKEIVEEIAFFFKSFADFMDVVSGDASLQVERCTDVAARDQFGKNRLERIIITTDQFFIEQAGEWNAAFEISNDFRACFAEGWSKLNKLSGKYITGDELDAYLKTASAKLTEILGYLDDEAKSKQSALEACRNQVQAQSART